MNADYTHILYVLDRSGSMSTVAKDVAAGFNNFIEEQKKLLGKCTFSLVQFDDQYEVVHSFKDIKEVGQFEFIPRGWTALLDAIGKSISETGIHLRNMPEEERPAKVLVVIHTDGEENKSTEYKKSQIAEMIKTQENVYNWKIAFVGTQFDVIGEASQMNFRKGSTLSYVNDSKGINDMYNIVTCCARGLRNADTETFAATQDFFQTTK